MVSLLNNVDKQFNVSMTFIFKLIVIIAVIGLLAGCPLMSKKAITYDDTKESGYYLSLINKTSGNDRINAQLLAARALIIENKLSQAQQQLRSLPADLNDEQRKEFQLSSGEIASNQKRTYDFSVLNPAQLTEQQKVRYYKIKIAQEGLKNDVNAQLHSYIKLEEIGTEQQRHQAINDTWDFLISLSEQEVSQILVYANEITLQGWMDLLYEHNMNGGAYTDDMNVSEEAHYQNLKAAISEWQVRYSSHPAAIYLPRTIFGANYLLPEYADGIKVALLLPLSGSSKVFGDVIQLGYMDGNKFYPNQSPQNVVVYDTTLNSLETIVRQVEQQGVNLIVGPLLKSDVETITSLMPKVPVLALNRIDEKPSNQDAFSASICYFGLAPESDAQDAARHLHQQNKHYPLIIAPKGEIGERVVKAFTEQWTLTTGSSEVYVQYFDDLKGLSTNMNRGIGLAVDGERVVLNPVQYNEPSEDSLMEANVVVVNDLPNLDDQKPDFDAIYIFATKDELTFIKSMLEMKANFIVNANDEISETEVAEKAEVEAESAPLEKEIEKPVPPIYTSPRSNSANVSADFISDMDRVQFSEIPLIVDQTNMTGTLPVYIQNDYTLVRLYAMGVDAWRLANQYTELSPSNQNVIAGMTGKISISADCEINRELIWQQYSRGKVRLIK